MATYDHVPSDKTAAEKSFCETEGFTTHNPIIVVANITISDRVFMPDIVLTTLNAKYAHASFGLRYLLANLGDLQERAALLEFEISQRVGDVLEVILTQNPKIVGIGVYIWNVDPSTRLVADLKRLRPDIIVVLGGPEVSYEFESQPIVQQADFTITGEADLCFERLCRALLEGQGDVTDFIAPLPQVTLSQISVGIPTSDSTLTTATSIHDRAALLPKIIAAELPSLTQLKMPYDLYSNTDLAQRVVYVEASRGCPFTCEFCLSALEIPVRQAALDDFLQAMQSLLDRGLKLFKFVDRTFNLNLRVSQAILEFFLERYVPGLFLHFEMIPDRFPDALRDLVRRFPAGSLQFEVGIQTFNDEVADYISRQQDNAAVARNLEFLKQQSGVHVHADLIVGLPGESLESFGQGFDRLIAMQPDEIQVGILKRLRGTPIIRHDAEWEMIYSQSSPYEVLQTKRMSYPEIQRMKRFARYWDLVANSGNFLQTTPLLWTSDTETASAFTEFLRFSDWLYDASNRTAGISLTRLAELVFRYLTEHQQRVPQTVANALWSDYQRGGRNDRPPFLREFISESATSTVRAAPKTLPRQQRRTE